MSRSVRLYLEDIKQSIVKIQKYTFNVSLASFLKDEKSVDAVVRNLSVIGEAAGKIPVEFKSDNQEIAWKEIAGMRNKIIHDYFGVDLEILWKTIKEDLPVLKKQIAKLLKK